MYFMKRAYQICLALCIGGTINHSFGQEKEPEKAKISPSKQEIQASPVEFHSNAEPVGKSAIENESTIPVLSGEKTEGVEEIEDIGINPETFARKALKYKGPATEGEKAEKNKIPPGKDPF
jgi:hypothetical protein